jgi:hypothetical protein
MAYVPNFEACMSLCDTIPGCVDVSFVKNSGGACYPKSGIRSWTGDDRILGGRLLPPAASSSGMFSTSATATSSSKAPLVTSTAQSTPSLSSISTSATPTSPIVPGFVAFGSYNYVGCWTDNVSLGLGRALRAITALVNTTTMTPSLCATYCTQYAYFGVEYGGECYVSLPFHFPRPN